KFNNPAANAPVSMTYCTYLGGSGDDIGRAIAVDGSQGAHLTGSTAGGFPSLNVPGFLTGPGGKGDAFLARVDTTSATSTGNYATFFGGSGLDQGSGVALDSNFATYIAGFTNSPTDFPTAGSPFQGALNGAPPLTDAFVSKVGSVSDIQIPPFFPV